MKAPWGQQGAWSCHLRASLCSSALTPASLLSWLGLLMVLSGPSIPINTQLFPSSLALALLSGGTSISHQRVFTVLLPAAGCQSCPTIAGSFNDVDKYFLRAENSLY